MNLAGIGVSDKEGDDGEWRNNQWIVMSMFGWTQIILYHSNVSVKGMGTGL